MDYEVNTSCQKNQSYLHFQNDISFHCDPLQNPTFDQKNASFTRTKSLFVHTETLLHASG